MNETISLLTLLEQIEVYAEYTATRHIRNVKGELCYIIEYYSYPNGITAQVEFKHNPNTNTNIIHQITFISTDPNHKEIERR